MMDQKRLEYLRQVERHADETGWVALLTQEDKDHFAYLRKVFKRYNITFRQSILCLSKSTAIILSARSRPIRQMR